MKQIFTTLLFVYTIFTGFQSPISQPLSYTQVQQDKDDSLIWQAVNLFTKYYNNRDVSAMNKLLPDDFMLQWLHENFLEKKGLLVSMLDTTIHTTLKHQLNNDSKSVIRYSDNYKSASLNTSFQFIDPVMIEAVKKENCYGLCIMYFQKRNGRWRLQTVHLDLHCTLCST